MIKSLINRQILNKHCDQHSLNQVYVCMHRECLNEQIFCCGCHPNEKQKHNSHKEQLVLYEKIHTELSLKYQKIYKDKENKLNRYLNTKFMEEYQQKMSLDGLVDQSKSSIEEIKSKIKEDISDLQICIQEWLNQIRDQSFQSLDNYQTMYSDSISKLQNLIFNNKMIQDVYKYNQFDSVIRNRLNQMNANQQKVQIKEYIEQIHKSIQNRKQIKEKFKSEMGTTQERIQQLQSQFPKYNNEKLTGYKEDLLKKLTYFFQQNISNPLDVSGWRIFKGITRSKSIQFDIPIRLKKNEISQSQIQDLMDGPQSIIMRSECTQVTSKYKKYEFDEKISGLVQLTINQFIIIQNQKISTHNFKEKKFEVAQVFNNPIQIVKKVLNDQLQNEQIYVYDGESIYKYEFNLLQSTNKMKMYNEIKYQIKNLKNMKVVNPEFLILYQEVDSEEENVDYQSINNIKLVIIKSKNIVKIKYND